MTPSDRALFVSALNLPPTPPPPHKRWTQRAIAEAHGITIDGVKKRVEKWRKGELKTFWEKRVINTPKDLSLQDNNE